ncbi:hypothetical protein ZWY2020_010715, partial [Hordeum vulgare]
MDLMRRWTRISNMLLFIFFLNQYAFVHISIDDGKQRMVTIEGDIKLLFVISSGLPTIKDYEHVTDLQMLSLLPV